LVQLYKSVPRLSSIHIYFDFISENVYPIFEILQQFKLLTDLRITVKQEINENIKYYNRSIYDVHWHGFKNLRFLDTDSFIFNDLQIYNLVQSIPTLEYLGLQAEIFNRIELDFIIPATLKSLDVSHYNIDMPYPDFSKYKYLKELNTGFLSKNDFLALSTIEDLEIFTFKGDDDFLTAENIHLFPNTIKVLKGGYIGYHNNLFNTLSFQNLELLGLENLGSLIHILPAYVLKILN
jgi:hypothetical protein